MKVEEFERILGTEFYTGVPDSLLKPLCNYLIHTYGIDKKHHIIAANEGNCVAIACGYHLATKKIPVVYMQNSGEGNAMNPIASLLNEKVYGIPMIFVIGWRGEPEVHDEPQHIFQGEITTRFLEVMNIEYMVIDNTISVQDLEEKMQYFRKILHQGKQVAFLIRKNVLEYEEKVNFANQYEMRREEIIEHIVNYTEKDIIIATTGKASRELFEIRERKNQSHQYDFLTVGSMGHASSIALGVAINKPEQKVWCIDGDGACLMHLGAMAVIGSNCLPNMIHIVLNNESHETVGGFPTVTKDIDLCEIAKACGYQKVKCVWDFEMLDKALREAKEENELTFIEIKTSIGARDDLGRPTISAIQNKENFMKYLDEIM